MHSTQTAKAYLALAAGITALLAAPFFVRFAQAPGAVTAFYRMTIATAVLMPFFLRSKPAPPTANRRGDLIFPLLAGASLAIEQILWTTGLQMTLVANAALLTNISPLWVALGAWLIFREKLSRGFWLGLALVMVGTAGVVGGSFLLRARLGYGDTLCLLASFFYAGYYLVTQRGRQHMGTLRYIWLVDLSAAVTLFIYVIAVRMPLAGFGWQTYLIFFALALTTQIVGYLAIGYAMGHLPAAVVSPTLIIQVVLVTILAVPIFGEKLTTIQWLSGVVVLGGIALVNRSRLIPDSGVTNPIPGSEPLAMNEPSANQEHP
jgi:drug/metabolite transporter (DMT)-like permease